MCLSVFELFATLIEVVSYGQAIVVASLSLIISNDSR